MTKFKEHSEDFMETYSNNSLEEMLDELYGTKYRLIKERDMVRKALEMPLVNYTDEQLDSLFAMIDDLSDAIGETELTIQDVLEAYSFKNMH